MMQVAVQVYNGIESELSLVNLYNSQNKLSPYARYRAHKFLHSFNIAAKNIETVFIYYNKDDYIEFYNCYFSSGHFTFDNWNNILKSHSIKDFVRFPSKDGNMNIAFIYSPFTEEKNMQDKVFVLFNMSELQKILLNSKWESNGAFLVYNSTGSILASTNPLYDNIDLSPYFHMDDFFIWSTMVSNMYAKLCNHPTPNVIMHQLPLKRWLPNLYLILKSWHCFLYLQLFL